MRKQAFCICENKDADQLRGNRKADQHLCFRYKDSTILLLSKSEIYKLLAIFCDCTAWFVSDQVGHPEDRFSHNEAHLEYNISFMEAVSSRIDSTFKWPRQEDDIWVPNKSVLSSVSDPIP